MLSQIRRGNAEEANASPHMKGWVVGHMHATPELEVKLWHYATKFDYGKKEFGGTELIIIYGGKLRLEMEDSSGQQEVVTLNGEVHEYILLPPGITKSVVVEEAPAYGVVVRWPSLPNINKIVA